ncbi:MAG: hypothetical protein ACFFBV_01745 [Promethearchaeota archaeon]
MLELREYLEFEKGTLPLIVSVPHGGLLECEMIPERSTGVLGIDRGTVEFAKNLIELIIMKFKKKKSKLKSPSYIFSKIRRSKVDLNRDENEAYYKASDIAREIYHFYHNTIQKLINYNLENFDCSLLIDIHGFEKDDRPPGFRDVELILGTDNLNSIFPKPVPKKDWEKNIRGKIIQKLLNLGISIAPGHPRRKEYVLTGGYITRRYGASHLKSKSQAMQIELSDRVRLYDQELRNLVLINLADILVENLV